MKQALLNRILERAKTRKDGIFVLDCVKYTVRDGRLEFLIDFNEVYHFSNGFVFLLGKVEKHKGRAKLKELMAHQKRTG